MGGERRERDSVLFTRCGVCVLIVISLQDDSKHVLKGGVNGEQLSTGLT